MDEFLQAQLDGMALSGEAKANTEAEQEVQQSDGQTSAVDTQVYDPKVLKEHGYPLTEPNVQPNRHTKEGGRMYANHDPATGKAVGRRIKTAPDQSMVSDVYINDIDAFGGTLRDAQNTQDAEFGIGEVMKKYQNYMPMVDSQEEYNRVGWLTAQHLEDAGYSHLFESDFDDEGIDDRGMIGLQYVMSAMAMRGAKTFEEASGQVGETGASEEQMRAAWDSAIRGMHRAKQDMSEPVPATNEDAMADPRYRGATETLLRAEGRLTPEEIAALTPEQVLSEGKMLADMIKNNFVAMGGIIAKAATNKDEPIGDALMFLLDADDAMPLEAADFGRAILGLATDPTTYVGGAGLYAKAGMKLAGKSAIQLALKKAGLVGATGATYGAGYGGLYDIGMQTIEKQGGRREEYDPLRFAAYTGMGATFGFILGGATSLAPNLKNSLQRFHAKFKRPEKLYDGMTAAEWDRYNVLDLKEQDPAIAERARSAADEFGDAPLPENVDTTLPTRSAIDDELTTPAALDELNAENHTLGNVDDVNIGSENLGYVDDQGYFHFRDIPADEQVLIDKLKKYLNEDGIRELSDSPAMHESVQRLLDELEGLQTRRSMTLIKGGATEADPNHMAPLTVVRSEVRDQFDRDFNELLNDPRAEKVTLDEFRKDMASSITERVDARMANNKKHIDAGDFRFTTGSVVTSKWSGKKFRIEMVDWDPKHNDARYLVTGEDGERMYMSEWGMVGGKPKLTVIDAKTEFGMHPMERRKVPRRNPLGIDEMDPPLLTPNQARKQYHDEIDHRIAEQDRRINKGNEAAGEFGAYNEGKPLEAVPKEQSMYRDELREAALTMDNPDDILAMYQANRGQGRWGQDGPPYFDLASGSTMRDRLTKPEERFWSDMFSDKEALMDLLDEVPSAYYKDGVFTLRREDKAPLEEYLRKMYRDGWNTRRELSTIPITIRRGTFVEKRLKDMDND